MIPNDYLAYEFKFPRMTLQLSQKYRLVSHEPTKPENREDGPRHFFRASMRQVSATEPSLARPPTEYQHLRRAMGFLPFPQDFINGPPSQPRQPPNNETTGAAVEVPVTPLAGRPATGPTGAGATLHHRRYFRRRIQVYHRLEHKKKREMTQKRKPKMQTCLKRGNHPPPDRGARPTKPTVRSKKVDKVNKTQISRASLHEIHPELPKNVQPQAKPQPPPGPIVVIGSDEEEEDEVEFQPGSV
ncbi:hypothetical protein B0H63DRAFT_515873 [Podospora didyma]|uniref:Uncharacterized protein n=1 Tax=Podospora didyma TaxID=330526 RepID=A0AAE0JW24_9PEZI|nr:hypothetical protein B0H63DRAFT_515873 [Podospora didyma]